MQAVAVLSGDLIADLRDILPLQERWPDAGSALLARQEGAAERLGALLGGASLISPIELAADVAVATAFGEQVEGVWRLGIAPEEAGLLVTEGRPSHVCLDPDGAAPLARDLRRQGVLVGREEEEAGSESTTTPAVRSAC